MGDALAIALMQVRHFKPRDFAQFHPGGEFGKRLLTTAEDVMRSDDMPIIPKEMHLGEAIIHVSKGKLGLGISLDEGNHVIGLITDGDIRRAMEKWQAEFFNKTVKRHHDHHSENGDSEDEDFGDSSASCTSIRCIRYWL